LSFLFKLLDFTILNIIKYFDNSNAKKFCEQAGRCMKVNYVSVVKEYVRKSKKDRFIIRASMDENPPLLWFKQLQLFWISSPRLIRLCPEPQLEQNEIIISIYNQEDIMDTINLLIRLIKKVKTSYIIQDSPSFLLSFKEQNV